MLFLPLVAKLLDLYGILIVAYVILGWVLVATRSRGVADLYRGLATLVEPYLGLFRRIIPAVMVGGGGLDFSPFIALIVLELVANILRGL